MINCFRWFVPTLIAFCCFTNKQNAVDGQCSSDTRPLNLNEAGWFVSPLYPSNYNNSADCQWLIAASASNAVVMLDFADFYTEPAPTPDYVYIYDGTSTASPQIGLLSGIFQELPYGYTSSQQYMFVRFTSNTANVYRGFNATFKSVVTGVGDPCSSDSRPVVITTTNSNLSSPNYPQNYPSNADCQWLILTPTSNGVVTLNFNDLSTGSSSDLVNIYNGMNVNGQLMASLSGDFAIAPTGFTTTTRSMFVKFTSSQSTTARGFTATAVFVVPNSGNPCSADTQPLLLITSGGQITSPLYPVNYPNNANCQWRILSSVVGGVVSISIYDFFTEANRDFVYILDGSDINAPQLAALTGTYSIMPAGIISRQSYMYVYFTTDGATVYRGFNSSFASVATGSDACQATTKPSRITSNNGTVLSPNYPLNYPTSSDCQWLIMSGEVGGVLTVDFADFYTQQNSDFLYLYDGATLSAPLIVRLTGSYIPLPSGYTTSQLYMYFWFASNTQSTYRGFNATYRSVIPNSGDPCSPATRPVVMTTSSGTFKSPNFPSSYPNSVDCQWLIIADSSGFVNLDFNAFSTETDSDLVKVYNGINTVAPLLTSLTGNYPSPPSGFISTQRYMFVRFTSSAASNSSTGFNASYNSFVSGVGDPCSASTKPVNILSSSGQIMSPLYPNAYPRGADCQWRIVSNSQSNGIVTVSFYDVNIVAPLDFLTIYDGSSYDWPVLTTISGPYNASPQGISSTQPYLYVRMQSDSSASSSGRGFNASYTSASSGANACSAATQPSVITGFSGSITSPNYPSNYPASSDCQWNLIAAPNSVVVVDFVDVYTNLNADYIYLYDGGSSTSPLLASLTGLYTTAPTGFTSSQRFMFLRFTSTTQVQRGFSATFYSVLEGASDPCSDSPSILIGDSGEFSSVNYSSSYPPYSTCGWRLMGANPNTVITVSFTDFSTAVTDYVNIYDGSSDSAPLLVSLSGDLGSLQGGYSTTQRYAYVQFVSGDPVSSRGFQAVYVAQQPNVGDPCSTTSQPVILTSSSATITSPMYPANYPSNSDCQWRIVSPLAYGGVTINFNVFSTRPDGDVVTIYDGPTDNNPLLVTLSGNYSTPPGGISTRQPYMFVRFRSGTNTNYQGFSATYTTNYLGTDPCSTPTQPSVVVANSGTITSPNYPNSYTNSADCRWRVVSATEQDVIVLDFTDVYTQAALDVVNIYDGSTASSQLIDSVSGFLAIAPQGYTSSQRYMFVQFVTDAATVYRGFSATFTSTIANSGDPCSPSTRPQIVTSHSDLLLSPGYPADYPPNSNCQWRVVSRLPNGVVQLDFSDFSTIASDGVLNLYDGTNTSSPLIASLSGSYDWPLGGYTTRTRVMFVQFLSGSSGSGRGFNATFTPKLTNAGDACSPGSQPVILLSSSGTIQSPNYPNNYVDNSDCQWRVVAANPSSVITINFGYFLTETNGDYVSIYDGPTADYPLLAALSGSYSTLPTGFSSRQQFIYIRFLANNATNFGGFTATFTSQITGANACASPTTLPNIQTAYSGIIASTNYPSNYPTSQDCRWRIVSSERNGVVVLDFYDIYLATTTTVYLYDGTTINSPLLTSQTDLVAVTPQGFTSSQPYMTVYFSSSTTVARGFNATYKSAAPGFGDACSATTRPYIFISYSATISSPGFPSNYPPNSDCQWRVVSGEPQGVVVIDFNAFNISASSDNVYIYDGPSSQDDVVPKLVTLTGSYPAPPRGITTTQRYMVLRFTTGPQSSSLGFNAVYSSSTTDVGDPCVSPLIVRLSASGTITSPTYPTNYPRNSDCQWRFISNSPLSIMTLSFNDFYTQQGSDFVYIYDGPTVDYPLLAVLSGNYTPALAPQGFSSRQRYMYVRFTSDENFTNKGFSATYTSQRYDVDACTAGPGIVLDYSGIITSPNHPGNYPGYSNCQWRLVSFRATCVLLLDFTAFYTQIYDYVNIYDGGSTRAPVLAQSLNGNVIPPPTGFRTTQRYLYMTFTSSTSAGLPGFSASYTSSCTDGTTIATTLPPTSQETVFTSAQGAND